MPITAVVSHEDSPLASSLDFTHLPTRERPIPRVTMLAYVVLAQSINAWLRRWKWSSGPEGDRHHSISLAGAGY
jgi:hypothetical protein